MKCSSSILGALGASVLLSSVGAIELNVDDPSKHRMGDKDVACADSFSQTLSKRPPALWPRALGNGIPETGLATHLVIFQTHTTGGNVVQCSTHSSNTGTTPAMTSTT